MTAKDAMKVRAIAPWFGGKRTLAKTIVRELGPHKSFFEPFCGSMAVLLAKPPSAHETANDLHFDLTNLARVLRHEQAAVQLYERCQRAIVSDDVLRIARKHLRKSAVAFETHGNDGHFSTAMVERAYWYFIASWMMRNGLAGTDKEDYQLAVRWTAGGGSPTVRWRSAVESIPAWHLRLVNVVILRRDAFAIIPKFEDAKHTAIYVDPPYMKSTRTGYSDSGGHGSRYKHEFDHANFGMFGSAHTTLAEMLKEFKKARVVVSYYDSPEVRKLYDGWTFVDCTRTKNLHAMTGRRTNRAEAPEVLIVNGPSYANT